MNAVNFFQSISVSEGFIQTQRTPPPGPPIRTQWTPLGLPPVLMCLVYMWVSGVHMVWPTHVSGVYVVCSRCTHGMTYPCARCTRVFQVYTWYDLPMCRMYMWFEVYTWYVLPMCRVYMWVPGVHMIWSTHVPGVHVGVRCTHNNLPMCRVYSYSSRLVYISPDNDLPHESVKVRHFNPWRTRVCPEQFVMDPVHCYATYNTQDSICPTLTAARTQTLWSECIFKLICQTVTFQLNKHSSLKLAINAGFVHTERTL